MIKQKKTPELITTRLAKQLFDELSPQIAFHL